MADIVGQVVLAEGEVHLPRPFKREFYQEAKQQWPSAPRKCSWTGSERR